MKKVGLLFVVIGGGCDLSGGERADTGTCPELTCSAQTPNGLHFYGEPVSEHDWLDDLFIDGPGTTAVGGTQRVTIAGLAGAPFAATTDTTAGFDVASTSGETVTIRGTGTGSNYLRIVDSDTGELYDRKLLYGAAITEMTIEPIEWEIGSPTMAWAFKSPDQVSVALWGHELVDGMDYRVRLVDTGMAMQLPAEIEKTAWDAIWPPIQAGTYSISVSAGDRARTALDVIVVDGIDDLIALDPPAELVVNTLQRVCFVGESAGRPVAGLAWQFQVDGHPAGPFPAANCVFISPAAAGTTDVTATAEGRQLTLHFPVVDAPARTTPLDDTPRMTSAGERAAW